MELETAVASYMKRFAENAQRAGSGAPDKNTYYRSLIRWARAGGGSGYRSLCEQALPNLLKDKAWEDLYRLLVQTAHWNLLPVSDGYDHSGRFWHLLDLAACEGTEALRRALPPELGLAKNGCPMFLHGTNLLMCLLYNTPEEQRFPETVVLEQAEKYIRTKHSAWERAVVAFLLCLHRRDTAGMTEQLQAVCNTYGKQKISKDQKLLCVNAYGLLMLARSMLPKEAFRQIVLPQSKNFSREYFAWRIAQTALPEGLYFLYPAQVEMMNVILTKPVAVGRIAQPYLDRETASARERKTWYADEERMLEELIRDLPG